MIQLILMNVHTTVTPGLRDDQEELYREILRQNASFLWPQIPADAFLCFQEVTKVHPEELCSTGDSMKEYRR